MFRAAHRSSLRALNCICSLWFIYPYGDGPLPRLTGHCSAHSALATDGRIWGKRRVDQTTSKRHIVVDANTFVENEENMKECNKYLQVCISTVYKMLQ